MKKESRLIANNKNARREFFIEDTYEAGLVLTGTEIKSIRAGRVNIKESYAKLIDGEVFIIGMHISPYKQGNIFNVDPLRVRKLLLNKREINKISEKVSEKGKTLVPLKLYINNFGLAKLQIGVAHGKKLYDKRADIAKKDAQMKIKRAVRRELR